MDIEGVRNMKYEGYDNVAGASLLGSFRFVTDDGKGERQQGRSSTALWKPGGLTREKRIMSVIRKKEIGKNKTIADKMWHFVK